MNTQQLIDAIKASTKKVWVVSDVSHSKPLKSMITETQELVYIDADTLMAAIKKIAEAEK